MARAEQGVLLENFIESVFFCSVKVCYTTYGLTSLSATNYAGGIRFINIFARGHPLATALNEIGVISL